MTNSKSVAIYIRVPKEPIERVHAEHEQLTRIKEYCLKKGYGVSDALTYKDVGSAQLNLKDRPGYSQLLDDFYKNKFSKVVVLDFNRLVRRPKDYDALQFHIKCSGVAIESASTGTSTDNMPILVCDVMYEMTKDYEHKLIERRSHGRERCPVDGSYE